jgi:hypothetical protein
VSTEYHPGFEGGEQSAPPAPEPESQAAPQNNPWEPWQQAGWQPDEVNPYEVRQAYDGWQALGNRDTRDYMLERMLQGNELPEGMSWQDAKEVIQQAWQLQQDPFIQQGQAGPDPYAGQQGQVDQYGYTQQDYADAAQQGIDPYQLRQAWQQDMRSELQQFQQQLEQQYEERAQAEEFTRSMDSLKGQYNLNDSDMSFIAPRAAEYVQPGVPMSQAIEQAFKDFDEWRRSAIASMANEQQQQSPQTFSPGGLAPSPEQPPRSLSEAAAMMENRFGAA